MRHAREDRRVQGARALVRRARLPQQAAEPERMHETGKHRRVGTALLNQPHQAHGRIRGPAEIHFELRIQPLRQGQ